jgi:DNA-binding CsgD family transcriptional regulator
MSLDLAVSNLIGDIYRHVRDPVAWNGVLDRMLSLTQSRFLMISAVDLRMGEYSQTYWYGADDGKFLDGLKEYEDGLYQDDPSLAYAARNPNSGFISLNSAIAKLGPDAVNSGYSRWVGDQLGVGNMVVRYTPPRDGLTLGISMHPSVARGSHDRQEVRLFLMLFDHIDQAMQLAHVPPDFENQHAANLLVDRSGKVRKASTGARAILALSDGLHISQGALRADNPNCSVKIDRAISSALAAITQGGTGGAVAVERPSGRRSWIVRVTPLPRWPEALAAFAPGALIRIIDADAAVPIDAPARWAEAFGLTPTETRLVAALMNEDGDLPKAAEQSGLRHSTARVHLRHIFDKTGVHSQVALVRLLQRLEG